MCSAMPMTSPRALGVMLSGAALAGWLAGSTLNPPVAETQAAPARRAPAPVTRFDAPHVAWPTVTRHVAPPAPSRNPFAFRAESRLADVAARSAAPERGAPPVAPDVTSAPSPVAPESPWRLSGIATSDDGDAVAVVSGAGDVFLVRAGDDLPGGDGVIEVGALQVTLRTATGAVTLRLP